MGGPAHDVELRTAGAAAADGEEEEVAVVSSRCQAEFGGRGISSAFFVSESNNERFHKVETVSPLSVLYFRVACDQEKPEKLFCALRRVL